MFLDMHIGIEKCDIWDFLKILNMHIKYYVWGGEE